VKKHLGFVVLHYLRFLAKLQIAKIQLLQKIKGKKLTIVGVTGSAGKSSTISACQAVIQDFYQVKTTAGSNSESGIPLNILGITHSSFTPLDWLKYCLLAIWNLVANWRTYDIFLVEMGIDGPDTPKNMSYLLKIVKPTIGIFLNVNLVHSQQFDKTVPENIPGDVRTLQILNNIGLEKAKLINSLPHSGYALLNINDPVISKTTQVTNAKKIFLKPIHIDFKKYAPPASFDISVSAAINLGKIFNISESNAINSLKNNLILPPSRCSVYSGIYNSTIIDSSYNSSPLACQEMLQVLAKYSSPKIAVLGDMRELGLQSKSAHEKIHRLALKSADTIISIGLETNKYFDDKSIKFNHWWQASQYIKQHLKPNTTILVKGSQNTIYLEELVKSLIPADKLKNYLSEDLICRQSPYWQKIKADFKSKNT
jgi:UDP-N-acetylmuramoyl-tripeptide--D-alanyl-D-alanine ligase